VWVTGHAGVILRTLDGGRTWTRLAAPGGDSLQFRDVHAVSRDTAYVLSAGPGDRSRIYQTTDGGATWQLQFLNPDPNAFYDCLDFWDPRHGMAVSDAVAGRLVLIKTENGGGSWTPVAPEVIPPADSGEGAFAASGTCLITRRPGHVWIASGARGAGKAYHSTDAGASWSVITLPLPRGSPASGVMTLAFRDTLIGAALGGDLSAADIFRDNVARTEDGGRTWTVGGRPPFAGAVYGSAYVGGAPPALVAVGPKGAGLSRDDGLTWIALSSHPYWAVGFGSASRGWMVGSTGRITRVDLPVRTRP
jgi:photosystem II stability/assembly factor-like uncharacterized protein